MSDDLKINSFLNRIKSRFVGDSYSSLSPAYFARSKKRKEGQQDEEPEELYIANPENEKLFNLGYSLGLSKNEVVEMVEMAIKAISGCPDSADFAGVILVNDTVKYPELKDPIPEMHPKVLDELKETNYDMYLVLTNPFDFMCKYPKTVSLERYKKFTYSEILEFSTKCPQEYEALAELARVERENEGT